MTTFANRLKRGIKRSGLAVKEVAAKAGITAHYLGALQRGDVAPPKASTTRALCRVLKFAAQDTVEMVALGYLAKRPRGVTLLHLSDMAFDIVDSRKKRTAKVGA